MWGEVVGEDDCHAIGLVRCETRENGEFEISRCWVMPTFMVRRLGWIFFRICRWRGVHFCPRRRKGGFSVLVLVL